ncbi:Thrombospondin-type laminin G domain and EAR repeat-containing protein [Lamellibrachia satsuma]|nr:Thrombospondin-type laminin G domain and EAR repeat-containing protein [Lamellibrachia satsuma]
MLADVLVRWLLVAIPATLFPPSRPQHVPGPCTDLKPIYVLRHAVGSGSTLPAGVEVAYDDANSLHAYRFTPRARDLHFPASAFMTACNNFPEEFSLLITLKLNKNTSADDQCIFALIPTGSTEVKLGIRLYKRQLLIDYRHRSTRRHREASFRQSAVFDGRWHTLIVSVTADKATLRVDCGRPRTRRMGREFPALLDTAGVNVHVGNCNRQRTGRFTVRGWVVLRGRKPKPM